MNKKTTAIIATLTIFIVFSILSWFNTFEKLDNSSYDMVYQDGGTPSPDIYIIAIDDKTIEALGMWPFSRKYMAQMINILSEADAAVIGIDVLYDTKGIDSEADMLLSDAIKKAGNVVLPVVGVFPDKIKNTGIPEADGIILSEKLFLESAKLGHINIIPDSSGGLSLSVDSDGVIRKALKSFIYSGDEYQSFDYILYETYREKLGITDVTTINTNGFNQFFIDFSGEPESYKIPSFVDVLNGEVDLDEMRDAIVLIGPYALGVGKDHYYTSVDTQKPMYGIEIHANILQNLIEDNIKVKAGSLTNTLILIFLGALLLFIYYKANPFVGIGVVLVSSCLYMYAAKIVYDKGIILQLVYTVIFSFVLYFFTIIYRYIKEYFEKRMVRDLFGRYVAPEIVDTIIKKGNDLVLGGLGRDITVLFVDIRGFTAFSEKNKPEKVVEILNQYFNLTTAAIFTNRGTLDKFVGDACMAIYNAPNDLDDHAMKAVLTAWEMKEKGTVLRNKILEEYEVDLNFGIGINSGYAVVGNIGAQFRMDYTAIGDTVNTAARLESNAQKGEILISKDTYERVSDRIKATYKGFLSVKNKETKVEVYSVDEVLQTNLNGTGANYK